MSVIRDSIMSSKVGGIAYLEFLLIGVSMSDEQHDSFAALHEALKSEEFRCWLTELELESSWNEACMDEQVLDDQRGVIVMTEEDNKRRQILEEADRYKFHDDETKKLIESPGFTVLRLKVQANRLIAHDAVNPSPEAARDAKNAERILESIERLGL